MGFYLNKVCVVTHLATNINNRCVLMSLICVKSKLCLQGHVKCVATVCQRYTSQRVSSDLKSNHARIAKQRIQLQFNSSIKLPKKKSWSSTAVLEALESTVGSGTIPPHNYAGSPHYFGGSPPDRKILLAAHEKGVQAADYVIKNHPQYFVHDFDADNINTWLP